MIFWLSCKKNLALTLLFYRDLLQVDLYTSPLQECLQKWITMGRRHWEVQSFK